MVFGCGLQSLPLRLLLGDSLSLISVQNVLIDYKQALYVAIVVFAGLFLYAVGFHEKVIGLGNHVQSGVRPGIVGLRLKMRAMCVSLRTIARFEKLVRTPCFERRWLLWLIYEHNSRIMYGGLDEGNEYKAAVLLVDLGILVRASSDYTALLFLPPKLKRKLDTMRQSDRRLKEDIDREIRHILELGKQAIKETGQSSFLRFD